MALSHFAARAVLGDYLKGRTLPSLLHSRIVQSVEARLIDGKTPVLDKELCNKIDHAASSAPAGASPSDSLRKP